MSEGENRLTLTARVVERTALRFTPAGLPALNLTLEHSSSVREAGVVREVRAAVKAVALGTNAERLASQDAAAVFRFTGFLATPRNGKHVVFHVQEFLPDRSPLTPQNAATQSS